MIKKLFTNNPHVLWQKSNDDMDWPNEAITICADSVGTICIDQKDQSIVINAASIPELCKLLKKFQ